MTKEELINTIQDELEDSDIATCQLILQSLRHAYLDSLFEKTVNPLWNNETECKTIRSILKSTVGTYDEKVNFCNRLGKHNFISEQNFFETDKVQWISKWLKFQNRYEYDAFIDLCHLSGSSVGLGEIALGLFCTDSIHTGRASKPGDVCIFDKYVEVKTKGTEKSSGGRLHDQKKAEYNWTECRKLFARLDYRKLELSLKEYITTIRPWLDLDDKQEVARTVIEGNFTHVNESETDALFDALVHGKDYEIKTEWAILGFLNYKIYSKFNGMLFLDLHNHKSVYVENFNNVTGLLSVGSIKLFGNDREAMPQITIKF